MVWIKATLFLIWRAAFKLDVHSSQHENILGFLSFSTRSHCYPFLAIRRGVRERASWASVRSYAHVCMSEQFDFSLCVHAKRTWRHVPFLSHPSSVQPRQGLSKAGIKGEREEEKVLPQLIWLLWGGGTLFPLMLWMHGSNPQKL